MALGDVIARLSVVLGMETAAFEQGATIAEKRLAQSAKRIEKFGDKISGIGTNLSVALSAPLAAIGTSAVKGFIEQERAVADVEAAITSMGGASGKTAKELSKTADALELNSLVDAEVILKDVSAQLLTFGNISGDVFDRAQQAVLDYSQRTGKSLVGASIMVGKALQDPVKGMAALSKAGVQLTDDQKALVKQFVATGNVAAAQTIILGELEKQNRRAAAAAADATPWRKAQVAIGQAMDKIGAAILPAIAPVAEAIASVATAFANLPEPMQKAIVVGLALAAALGPVLIAFGSLVSFAAPMLATIKMVAGLAAATGTLAGGAGVVGAALGSLTASIVPLGLAIGAAYLVWKNWDTIGPMLQELWSYLESTFGPPLRELFSAVGEALTALWNGPFGEGLRDVVITIVGFSQKWSEVMGPALITVLKGTATVIGATLGQIANIIRLVTAVLSGDWDSAWKAAKSIVGAVVGPVISYVQSLYSGVRTWLQDKLGAVFDWVNDKIRSVERTFFWLYDQVVANSWIPDMVTEVGQHMNKLDALMVDPAKRATAATNEAFRALAADVGSLLDRLFPQAAKLKALREDLATIDAGEKAGLISGSVAEEARYRRKQEEHGARDTDIFTKDPGKAIPIEAMRQHIDKFNASMRGMGDTAQVQTVRIAKSFKDMATDTLNALDRMAQAVKGGGFLDILSAVIGLGIQLGSVGAFGKKIQGRINKAPGYAVGTNSAQRGFALVGERGPELVDFNGGERVYTNAQTKGLLGGRGGGNTYNFSGNLMTPEFWAQIQQGDQMAAVNGAGMATNGLARSRKWSLA